MSGYNYDDSYDYVPRPVGKSTYGAERINMAMFKQREVWMTKEKVVVAIRDLEADHVVQIVAWLEQHKTLLSRRWLEFRKAGDPSRLDLTPLWVTMRSEAKRRQVEARPTTGREALVRAMCKEDGTISTQGKMLNGGRAGRIITILEQSGWSVTEL